MGRTYLFECSKCGYRATVSGGADRGFHVAVQTVLCFECKQLHDAVTEFRVSRVPPLLRPALRKRLKPLVEAAAGKRLKRPPTLAAALNRLPLLNARHFEWLRFAPACPVFPRHRIREWNQPDRCPKCGVLLQVNALPFRLWD
jgi:hypothetical protein